MAFGSDELIQVQKDSYMSVVFGFNVPLTTRKLDRILVYSLTWKTGGEEAKTSDCQSCKCFNTTRGDKKYVEKSYKILNFYSIGTKFDTYKL